MWSSVPCGFLQHPGLFSEPSWYCTSSTAKSSLTRSRWLSSTPRRSQSLQNQISNCQNQSVIHAQYIASSESHTTTTVPTPKPVASNLTTATVSLDDLSPMIQHYVQTKRRLSLSLCATSTRRLLLMYRVGDFFESFFEDAYLLSTTCSLALTSKNSGKALGARIPMAGVPHHAADSKIRTLIANDVTVAVVDQVQPADQAASGALVRRAITRLVTPATICDDALLDAKRSVYLAALVVKPNPRRSFDQRLDEDMASLKFGFAYADVSTGEFRVTSGVGLDAIQRVLVNISPSELLLVGGQELDVLSDRLIQEVRNVGTSVITHRNSIETQDAEDMLTDFHSIDNVESIGCRGKPLCVEAAAVLLLFTRQTLTIDEEQGKPLPLSMLKTFGLDDVMLLDASCLRNMEVVQAARDGGRSRSLQWAVDRTVTSMGARCLRSWLLAPSLSLTVISSRHSIVEALLFDGQDTREFLQVKLRKISDLERLSGRVGAGRASPREMAGLAESVLHLPSIFDSLKACLERHDILDVVSGHDSDLVATVECQLISLAEEIQKSLNDPAPSSVISELTVRGVAFSKDNLDLFATQIFRSGYNHELDTLRSAIEEPEKWIAALEDIEKKRTGIESLRIKHVKNTGFVLRTPRSVGEKKMDEDPMFFVKLGYERVQSTKAEIRFRFEELKSREKMHTSAFSEIVLLELRLYEALLDKLSGHVQYIRELGRKIASIDVLCGFAQVAEEQNYVKPVVYDKPARILDLEEARHPVVEQTLPVGRTFVPNSFRLGAEDVRNFPDLMVLCGPNAAGKSCALRSIGLICILAQAGSFVPARAAKLSLCDRIFTRVGAVDDLARGQSTFQVEMAETACILSHATSSSLVLLDEIGRGTSTVDGIAIAWSVSEHLAKRCDEDGRDVVPPRTMFVTHYHELNQLAMLHSNVKSFSLHMERNEVREGGAERLEWVSTHKVVPGASFESLGLAVARRAGFPQAVINRAEEIAGLLHEPSRALGAELRRALSGTDIVHKKQLLEGHEDSGGGYEEIHMPKKAETEAKHSVYEEGYRSGYEQAKSDVYEELENLLKQLQPGRNME